MTAGAKQDILLHSRPGASAQKRRSFERTRERTGVFQVWANMGSHFKNCHKNSAKKSMCFKRECSKEV